MLLVTGLLRVIHCWSKYSWCLWGIKNWMLKSATSHSAQKLNLQRVKICQIWALLLLQKSHHTYSRWWFPSKPWLCGTSGIAWSGKSLPVFMDGTFQMPWKSSLCARVAFTTAFLIASIKFLPTKADFRGDYLFVLSQEGVEPEVSGGLSGKVATLQEGLTICSRRNGKFTIACDLDSFLFISQWSTEVPVYVVIYAYEQGRLLIPITCSPRWSLKHRMGMSPSALTSLMDFSLRTALQRKTRWTSLYLNDFHRVTKPVNGGRGRARLPSSSVWHRDPQQNLTPHLALCQGSLGVPSPCIPLCPSVSSPPNARFQLHPSHFQGWVWVPVASAGPSSSSFSPWKWEGQPRRRVCGSDQAASPTVWLRRLGLRTQQCFGNKLGAKRWLSN